MSFQPFLPWRNERLQCNSGPWMGFQRPLHSRRDEITTHSHSPCSHWKKATGPETRITAHERPWNNPPSVTSGPGTPACERNRVPCLTFPEPGPSPGTTCAANVKQKKRKSSYSGEDGNRKIIFRCGLTQWIRVCVVFSLPQTSMISSSL